MKSIYLVRYGSSYQAFEIREEEDPFPREGEVTLRVEASGLNFADVLSRLGLYQDAPKIPCVLGYEVVGRIDRVGSGVEGVRAGDRVAAFTRFGGYASHVVVDSRVVVPIPEDMNAGVAAALTTQYCTAWYAAEEMVRLHKGDHVLIQAAAGGVGMALVQIAKRRGCIIFGTAGSKSKLEVLEEMGVDHPINYRDNDFAAEINKICGDQGLDVVFESLGGKVFKKSLDLLGSGGRIVTLGVAQMVGKRGSVFRSLKTVLGFGLFHPVRFLLKSQSMIGVNMLRIADNHPEILQRCQKNVMDLARQGELSPKVGGIFPAEQISEAHEFLGMRKSVGKVILKWTP